MRLRSQICNHHKEEPEDCADPHKILSNTYHFLCEHGCHLEILVFLANTRTSVFLQIEEVMETLDNNSNEVPRL